MIRLPDAAFRRAREQLGEYRFLDPVVEEMK